jgi:Flp pilus assembly protein CpaB
MDPEHWEVEEILQNVRVIAIDDRLTMSRQQHLFAGEAGIQEIQDAGGPQNVVTLELTPNQAKTLIKARAGGGNYLSLLLRPGSPGVVVSENPADGG